MNDFVVFETKRQEGERKNPIATFKVQPDFKNNGGALKRPITAAKNPLKRLLAWC